MVKKAKKKKKARKTRAKSKKTGRKKAKKRPITKKKKKAKKKKTKKKTQRKTKKKSVVTKGSRDYLRVPLKIKIDYFKDPGVFLYDYSKNLGRGGIFIESEDPMPAGTEITLIFTLPSQSSAIEVKGKVAWTHQREKNKPFSGVPGMGIQFINQDGQHKEALDQYFREIDYDNLTF